MPASLKYYIAPICQTNEKQIACELQPPQQACNDDGQTQKIQTASVIIIYVKKLSFKHTCNDDNDTLHRELQNRCIVRYM